MKALITFVCLLLVVTGYSQSTSNLSVSISDEYKDKTKAAQVLSIHTGENGITSIAKDGKKDYVFDLFDQDLNLLVSEVVPKENNEYFVGDLFYGNTMKVFTVDAPKRDERVIYCHTLNLDTKAYHYSVIFETTVEKKQALFGSRKNHRTNFAVSPNGNYFAIATDDIRKNRNSYTIRVFDAESEKMLYKQSYQQSDTRFYTHNDLHVDNGGSAYSIGKLYQKGTRSIKFLSGDPNYDFVLNKVSADNVTDLLIQLEGEHIQNLHIEETNNQLQLVGFYSDFNVARIKGACNFIIDTEAFAITDFKSHLLPNQVFQDLYGENKADRFSKNDKELLRFTVDHTITDSEGNIYIVAEKFYVTTSYVNNGTGAMSMQTVYHYDDIIVIKLSEDGNLDWGRSILKKSNAPSYNAFLKNDELHILLNSGKNLTQKTDGRTKVKKNFLEATALYDIAYTKTGEVTYNKIQDNTNNGFYHPFYGTYQDDRFIMMSGGKWQQFMILE
jgi:hypothetical protein